MVSYRDKMSWKFLTTAAIWLWMDYCTKLAVKWKIFTNKFLSHQIFIWQAFYWALTMWQWHMAGLSLMLILILDSFQFLITFHFDWMSCVVLENEFVVEKYNGLIGGWRDFQGKIWFYLENLTSMRVYYLIANQLRKVM